MIMMNYVSLLCEEKAQLISDSNIFTYFNVNRRSSIFFIKSFDSPYRL